MEVIAQAFFTAYQAAAVAAHDPSLTQDERDCAENAVHAALSGLAVCDYCLTPDASGIVAGEEAEFA